MSEPMYTLEQARRIIMRGTCESFGHSLEMRRVAPCFGRTRWFCTNCDVVVKFVWPEDEEAS